MTVRTTDTLLKERTRRCVPVWLAVVVLAVMTVALAGCKSEPAGTVSFEVPADGAEVVSPFVIRMSADGLTVEPAGTVRDGYGHHHILVDAGLPPAGQPIPADDQHRHFGKGQTEATLDLSPGEHTLTLLFAGGDHVPYDPPITRTIRVTVE